MITKKNMKEDLEGEIWKDIPEYEGLYQVSNFGRVKSLPKEWIGGNGARRKHSGKILKGTYQNGYSSVMLYKDSEKPKRYTIHQLVAMAFLGHIPDGMNMVVDHIDRNPSNNRVDNLQVISNRENTSKDRVGTSKYCGVGWNKKTSKWIVSISIGYERIHLGLFIDEEEAGEMYQAALKYIDKYDGNPKEFRDYLKRI